MADLPVRKANRNWNLPNFLTYGRVAAVPVVVALPVLAGGAWARWTALAIFTAAAITDFFDGYLARAWSQQSSLGRMLDPIADKLLVAAVLLDALGRSHDRGASLWAAIVILCREILVSGLREYLAELRVPVPGDGGRQMEDGGATGRARLSHRRPRGRGRVLPGVDRHRHRAALGRRDPDALHRLGLYEGELRPRRRRSLKAVYFAWVRERIGKARRRSIRPPSVATSAS
jgi:phosphatidylglycerophosphate synthase